MGGRPIVKGTGAGFGPHRTAMELHHLTNAIPDSAQQANSCGIACCNGAETYAAQVTVG